eukprot:13342015-Alexandrium_andersonii.AAC.1
MRLWGLEHEPDTWVRKRGGLTLSLLDEKGPRQHCLREAWRAATWSAWRLRGNRREAHLARAAAPGEAIRRMIDRAAFGQHVLAIVTGATFSEARLETCRRLEERRKRKRKRDVDVSLQACAAGGDASLQSLAAGEDSSSEHEAEEPASDEEPDLANCGCGIPEPPYFAPFILALH